MPSTNLGGAAYWGLTSGHVRFKHRSRVFHHLFTPEERTNIVTVWPIIHQSEDARAATVIPECAFLSFFPYQWLSQG